MVTQLFSQGLEDYLGDKKLNRHLALSALICNHQNKGATEDMIEFLQKFDKTLRDIFEHCQSKKLPEDDPYTLAVFKFIDACILAKREFKSLNYSDPDFAGKLHQAINDAEKELQKPRGMFRFFHFGLTKSLSLLIKFEEIIDKKLPTIKQDSSNALSL
jgi:hypothetical protein